MLGISSETIRNYEKKGLIHPCKDEYSNYRYFDIIQLNQILNIQRLHQYGYSLHEVGDLLEEPCMEKREAYLEQKEMDLIREIYYMNLRLESLRTTISSMEQARHAKTGCFFGERPALYYVSYQKQFDLILDQKVQEELVRWLHHADLPFMSGRASRETIQAGKHEFEFGFCLDKATAEFMGIRENDVVKYYQSCPAIIFYYEATPDSQMKEASGMLLDFLEKHQLKIKEESLSRVIFADWNQNDYTISHLVWVPYETLNK